jgi:hypothetical protein
LFVRPLEQGEMEFLAPDPLVAPDVEDVLVAG